MVDPDYMATVRLNRDQARALAAVADADTGAQALRTAVVVRLLLHNTLRVDEACAADVADLREDSRHREHLPPHSLRHSAITFALDAGASLRDVQDYVGHKDSRDSLNRNAAYTVAAYLA